MSLNKTLITELTALRAQALEMADKATVLINRAGADQVPASLKSSDLKRIVDRRNAKIFNKNT